MRPAGLIIVLVAATLCCSVGADVGVFTGTGQSVRQVTTKSIHLSTIDVTISPGRGRLLFDGGVAGLDEVDYLCRFELSNPTNATAEVQVGFPLDSQFARLPAETEPATRPTTEAIADLDRSTGWVAEYGFIARDADTTYHVTFQSHKPTDAEPYSALFTWSMSFAPHQTRLLTVVYHIPASVTLFSTSRSQGGGMTTPNPPRPWMDRLCQCMLERIGYTTATGSSWAGPVDHASFTVLTDGFEKYLDYRGGVEVDRAALKADERAQLEAIFPTKHSWWFREVTPAVSQKVNGGLVWKYAAYKPADPIMLSYYVTNFPRVAEEVDAWVNSVLADDTLAERPADLTRLRQVFLARFGQVPADPAVKTWVEDQVWYRANPKFALEGLSPADRAVAARLDGYGQTQAAPR